MTFFEAGVKGRLRSHYYRLCFLTSVFNSKSETFKTSYDTDYSVFPVFARVEVEINKLRFNILGLGMVKIWDTPHFAFISGKQREIEYTNYIEQYYGVSQVEPTLDRFSNLGKYLQNNAQRRTLLGRVTVPRAGWMLVVDGTHRAALAALDSRKEMEILVTDH